MVGWVLNFAKASRKLKEHTFGMITYLVRMSIEFEF